MANAHKGKKAVRNVTPTAWSTMLQNPEQANKKQNTHRDTHGKQPDANA